jgi:hypothetical protein
MSSTIQAGKQPKETKMYVKLVRAISEAVQASGNDAQHEMIEDLQKLLPSGSGIDSGCKIDLVKSTKNKIKIDFGFHHMNESGTYDGWTDHTLTIEPCLSFGFSLKITGRNRNQIKDYLYETFDYVLNQEVEKTYKDARMFYKVA